MEARNRLGGRTWTRNTNLGRELDIGGTWVHWIQPHVWAEVTRYGLDLIASPEVDTAYWRVGEEVVTGSAKAMLDLLDAPMTAVVAESREVLPQPYDYLPLSDRIKELDQVSIADKIADLDLATQNAGACSTECGR